MKVGPIEIAKVTQHVQWFERYAMDGLDSDKDLNFVTVVISFEPSNLNPTLK